MTNMKMTVKGTTLLIEVDLTKTFGSSSTGKTTIIASSQGNQPVDDGHPEVKVVMLLWIRPASRAWPSGLNVYTPIAGRAAA